MSIRAVAGIAVFCALAPIGAHCWTPPFALSEFGPECSRPRIARGSGGSMHVCWLNKSEYRVYYRFRASNGNWTPTELISISGLKWSDRADVAEDSQGRPHIVYAASIASGAKPDLYEAVKIGGSWTTTQLTNTSGADEDYPRIMPDSLSRLHMVYRRGSGVVYRVWSGSSWSAETSIGGYTGDADPYFHRPDISVDSNNNLHVVWHQNSTTLVYRKHNGSTWLSQTTIGTTSGFLSYCAVANAGPNNIVAVTYDDNKIMYVASANGGANWGAYTYLNDGHYPKMDSDASGNAHLIYEWSPANYTGYRKWNGSSWTPAVVVSPYTRWQGWPDVAAGTDGAVYAVYDDGEIWPKDVVQFVSNQDTDSAPPAQVSPFTVSAGDKTVFLNWTNPTDPDYKGTIIRWSTSGYPTSASEGSLLCDRPAARGSADSFTQPDLTNGIAYYYSAFTYDARPNYSAPAHALVTPRAMTCDYAERQPDGATIDLRDKIITAVFSADTCVYIAEQDRSSGVRVGASVTGLAVGDRVDVTGTIGTRKFGALCSERVVSPATVTRLSAAPPVQPLGMACRAVGGAEVPPSIPGVIDGVGPNNMGLLVRIAGSVTSIVTSYIYLDDGSGAIDPTGREGVMVRCPGAPTTIQIGDRVAATGIVEGSIPTGASANRRLVRTRDWNDIREY